MSSSASLALVETTSPQINVAGAAHFFHADTLARGKEVGLDGFRFYFLGRGGVLGDVEASVVTSAFGYFHPAVVSKVWNSARETMSPRAASREYLTCAENIGRKYLSDVDELEAFNDAAEAIAAGVDLSTYALFAGLMSEPLPDNAAARAYRNVMALRELRGGVHLLSIVASGLSPAVAHAIRRPNDTAAFGWDPAPDISESDRSSLVVADDLTDELMVPMVEVLSADQASAFAAGAEAIFRVFEDANRFQNRSD